MCACSETERKGRKPEQLKQLCQGQDHRPDDQVVWNLQRGGPRGC